MSVTKDEQIAHTEASVLTLLRKRHAGDKGNGPEYAYVEKVRNAAGFAATRTADAMALSLWPSRGHELHGFEVKVSRADWRTELKNVAKAEVWTGIVDRWWVVAPKGIVPKDELPASWGLMEVTPKGDKLTVAVQAPLLTEKREDIKRGFLVPLLRAAGAGLAHTPEQAALDRAFEEGRAKGKEQGEASSGNWKRRYEDADKTATESKAVLAEVEKALGVTFREWSSIDKAQVEMVCKHLHALVHADQHSDTMVNRLRSAQDSIDRLALDLRRTVQVLEAATDEQA